MTSERSIEVLLPEHSSDQLAERIDMPLYFLIGGADDEYLTNLVGQPIQQLVKQKSVDTIPQELPYVVYASRSLLPATGYARVFSLEDLLKDKWPILLDIEQPAEYWQNGFLIQNLAEQRPSNVERTWIIRALKRANQKELAAEVLQDLKASLYAQKLSIDSIPVELTVNSLSQLYMNLSSAQRNYALMIFRNSLPIQLNRSLGDVLAEISLTGSLVSYGLDQDLLMEGLQNALQLLQIYSKD